MIRFMVRHGLSNTSVSSGRDSISTYWTSMTALKTESSMHTAFSIHTGRHQSKTQNIDSGVPEIFVDSSRWGVGFVHNGRWTAWKLMQGWEADGRDNNWAEMVAVELGLLAAASAGFQSRAIIARSDNTGVVKALQKGANKHLRQTEVLKRIEVLMQSHKFDLEVQWVPSHQNPADRPSRGVLPPEALRFPATIDLPDQLRPFITSDLK